MNRSIFQSSPFRPSYGLQPASYNMGQLEDFLGEDITGLLGEFDSFLLKLPVDVAGNYGKKRDECIAKPFLRQYKCLYDLFQEIKKAYKDDGTPVTPTPTKPPPKSELPILPIAIGAVALTAILYFAFGRGS